MDCYWLLIRLGKPKEDWVMGNPMLSFGLLESDYESNRFTLLKRLNELDAFDKALDLRINVRL
jgi:hypothetical protein